MPSKDRTGPSGDGPATGRGLGPCVDGRCLRPRSMQEVDVSRGVRRGLGQRRGLGRGLGRGSRQGL